MTKRTPLTPALINQALAGFSTSPAKGRKALKALLRTAPSVGDRIRLLTAVRKKNNPKLRRHVVRVFVETNCHADLITGASIMTRRDATLFYRDYFAVGGKLRQVTDWLGEISTRYIREKRKGNIDPAYDGFWDNAWNAIVNTVDTIGEAVTNTVDAVVAAGHEFSELVSDIVDNVQRRIDEIVETLLDAGKQIGELISGVIAGAVGSIDATLQKVVAAILAAGKKLVDVISAIYDNAQNYVRAGIKALISVGARIRDIVKAGIDLALATLSDIVGYLVDLGHSVWYILKCIGKESTDVIKAVFLKLLQLGKTLGDLVEWCALRSFEVMKKGLTVLFMLGFAVYDIAMCILRRSTNLRQMFRALRDLGAAFYDLLRAGAALGVDILKQAYHALVAIGFPMAAILVDAAKGGLAIFVQIAKWLMLVQVTIFEILLWSLTEATEVFGWAMQAADAVFESLLDIVVWACSVGDTPVARLAAWLAEAAKGTQEWFKNKVLLPLVTAGKIYLLIKLATASIVFLVIALVVFDDLWDPSNTEYHTWPKAFADFKSTFASKTALLTVSDQARYVVLSDAHKESKEDVSGGMGHFYKNKELFKAVLQQYLQDETWTVIALGDDEDFWITYDLLDEGDPVEKVEPIIAENADLYGVYSEQFYKNASPRRFVKIRGNHDDVWKRPEALSRLRKHGFPDINVYDYAVISGRAKDILLMHGHQYDDLCCDANNAFGKFASNFAGEPFETISNLAVQIFGAGADLEDVKALASILTVYTPKDVANYLGDVGNFTTLSKPSGEEKRLPDTMANYDCSMIIGHTHVPRLLRDGRDATQERFYANTGTCGWWEGCAWTVEVTKDDVALKVWTTDGGAGAVVAKYTWSLVGTGTKVLPAGVF
ncbi:MAG: metallophosphoesterase [Bryobacteraceae bacterium]